MRKFDTAAQAIAVVALVPCVWYPLRATHDVILGMSIDLDGLQYVFEALGGPVTALACGAIGVAVASTGRRVPLSLLAIGLMTGIYGFMMASRHSHDWGHTLFDECGTGRLEKTLLPLYLVAGSIFVVVGITEVVVRRRMATAAQQPPNESE